MSLEPVPIVSVSAIVQAALETGCLSERQEQYINNQLWAKQFSAQELEALDALVEALHHHRVKVAIDSAAFAA